VDLIRDLSEPFDVDLTRNIVYRAFSLNQLTKDANQRFFGCETKRVQYPGVAGIGYAEKRALADGYDASDVYLDRRVINLQGILYGITRGDLFDRQQEFTRVMTPTAAYNESPGDKGFLPLDFYVPTMDTDLFPAGYIHKALFVRPVRQPGFNFVDDATGGPDADPLALPWDCVVWAKDPTVYGFSPNNTVISDTASSGSGNFTNVGDLPAPLQLLLVVKAGSGAGTFHLTAGGADMTITIPANAAQQVIRYSAREKVLMLEVNATNTLRMDLLSMVALTTHPLIPVGNSAYAWTLASADLDVGGRLWFWDAWA